MIQKIFFGILMIALLTQCSDQKDQVKQGVPAPNPTINTNPGIDEVDPAQEGEVMDPGPYVIPGNEGYRQANTGFMPRYGLNNERDDRTEENSKKPIIFDGINGNNTGVAGINFGMTLDEARDLLGPSTEYSCGYFYEEGICVDWKKDDPRKPVSIFIIGNYLGYLDMPAPIGKVRMGEKFDKFFAANDPMGTQVLEQIYRTYFKIDDPTYSCIADGKCEAREIDTSLLWRIPNMLMLFSKDQSKQLYQMMLENKSDPGILTKDFDITKGAFEDQALGEFKLGETWNRFITDGETQDIVSIVDVTSFRKEYDGVTAGIYRPDAFSAEVVVPYKSPIESTPKDVLGSVSIFGGYPGAFLLDGKYIVVKEDGSITLVDEPTQDEANYLLKTKVPQLAGKFDAQVAFLQNIKTLIENSLKAKYSNLKLASRIEGLNARPSLGRWLNVRINYQGQAGSQIESGFIFVGTSVNNGYAQVLRQKVMDPFVDLTYSDFDKPLDIRVKAKNKDGKDVSVMSGFQIGDTVKLTNIDWLRLEATVNYKNKAVRVSFNPWNSVKISRFENDIIGYELWTISSVGGTLIGLTPTSASPFTATEIEAEIKLISAADNPAGVKGLCGLDVVINKNLDFETIKQTLLTELNKATPAQKCRFFGGKNATNDDEYTVMYFTDQNIKLTFIDKQFLGVVIYE